MNSILNVNNISWKYPDGTIGLRDVSFKVIRGEAVGIVGPNGAGKTTLINHLNGFFMPQHGGVSIDGIEICKKNREMIRKRVGIVFQNADDQLFMPTVREDLFFGPRNLGMDPEQINRKVTQIASFLNIDQLLDRPAYRLSQGQKRFCALGTILVMEPDIIVFDEPTADLDPGNRRRLINTLMRLDGTRIVVSHDLDFIWDVCKRVLIIDSGKIVADGPTKTVLTDQFLLNSHCLELPLRLQKIT